MNTYSQQSGRVVDSYMQINCIRASHNLVANSILAIFFSEQKKKGLIENLIDYQNVLNETKTTTSRDRFNNSICRLRLRLREDLKNNNTFRIHQHNFKLLGVEMNKVSNILQIHERFGIRYQLQLLQEVKLQSFDFSCKF